MLKSRPEASPETLMQMRALEQAAKAAQQAYETYKQELPVATRKAPSNVGTMIPAMPAMEPVGPSLVGHMVAGMGVGLAGGLALSLMAGAFRSRRPNLADLARPPVGPNAVAPDPETDGDPDRMAIEDAWADLEANDTPEQPAAPQEVQAEDDMPSDDYDQEAEAIRAEIRKMRQMVEQMQQADRRAATDNDPPDEPRD